MRHSILSAALLLSTSATNSARAQEWYDLEQLPMLRPEVHADYASSYDRSGGNLDLANDFGFDSHGDRVLLDKAGAGCVDRIWFATIVTLGETLRVYIDGDETPRIVQPFWSLFSGKYARFPAPLVGNISTSSGGYISYVPLCHRRSIRVTLSPGLLPRYYNISHHTLSAGRLPDSFSADDLPTTAVQAWQVQGVVDRAGKAHEAVFDLSVGESRTLLDEAGPGLLSSLELLIPGLRPQRNGDGTTSPEAAAIDVLNGLRVQAFWDGELSPSIDAPAGALFAIGDFGPGAAGGLLAGQADNGVFYLKFPMPFRQHARIVLRNGSNNSVRAIATRVIQKPLPAHLQNAGKLSTAHHALDTKTGKDLTVLDVQGSGHVVGLVLSERGNESRQYLEGDERIFIDGLRSPTIHGTGTEDFFNGAWYYNRGVFALPTHGARSHLPPSSKEKRDATAQFRFLLADAIPFRSGIRFNIEHGPANDEPLTGSSLVYYYRAEQSVLTLSDTLRVGDRTSERAHGYAVSNSTWHGARTYTFHGRDDDLHATATGRAHRGVSRFTLAVDPRNRGVLLRRLFDQSVAKQRAEVWIDGTRAGIWYTPDHNLVHSFREEDFPIPVGLTLGKSSLSIEVRFMSSAIDWNEFQYQTLSVLP